METLIHRKKRFAYEPVGFFGLGMVLINGFYGNNKILERRTITYSHTIEIFRKNREHINVIDI